MKRVCGWCGCTLGWTADGQPGETTGICPACRVIYFPDTLTQTERDRISRACRPWDWLRRWALVLAWLVAITLLGFFLGRPAALWIGGGQ